MPRIRLSQTQLRTSNTPDIRVGRGWNEGLSAMERATHATVQSARHQQKTIDRAIQTFDRSLHEASGMMHDINYIAELDARDVKAEWDKTMLDGIEGSVGEDGNTHGGIVNKTWQDYEHGKTSPITDLGEIEKNFQESESYKGMNSIVRRKFDRMVSADRARYLSMANRMYDRNEIERKKFLDERADANGDRKIETVIAAKDEKGNIDDAVFETVAREETIKKVGRRMTRFMTNPEILDDPTATPESIKWKDEKFAEAFWNEQKDELRKVSIGRCEKLAENAGFGNPQWIEGKLVTNDEQLAAAERYIEELANPKTLPDGTKLPARISPEEAKALGYKCLQARSQLDHRVAQTLAAESANALAKGDLASLEAAEKKFAVTAESFKGNQQRESAALIAKNKVSEAADERATLDLMGRIANGEQLSVTVQGPDGKPVTRSIFDPKTQARYARCYPKALEEMGKLHKNGKSNNDTELRYAEAALDYLEADGLHSDEDIERAKRLVYEKGDILAKSRALTPEDAESFRNRWAKRNTKEEAKAAVEFDRAFGVSFDLKPDGTTSKDVSTIEKHPAEYNPKYPGTGESVNLKKYMKMRSAFIERLRALPPDADRVKETRALISEFKGGWFKDRTAENIEEMVTRMTEINNEAASRIAAERLREAEAQRIRNLPVVSMERPENKEPMENPLDFYNVLGAQSLQQ